MTAPVHEIVGRQAAADPDAVAVVDAAGQLTYGELDAAAEQLAVHLRLLGAGSGSVIGICLGRGCGLVVAEFGVLKAGAAFLPLAPGTPVERMRYALTESAARLLIIDGDSGPALARDLAPVTTVTIGRSPSAAAAVSVGRVRHGGLAYVIYTSGSTGHPKGVMLGHRGLANLVAWHRAHAGLGPGIRTTLVASPGFDVSIWEIWPTLVAGATLYAPDAVTLASPMDMWEWLEHNRISVALLPTPIAESLLALPGFSTSALRLMYAGGDRLSQRPARGAGLVLYNAYGPTENTVVSTAGAVDGPDEQPGLPSIGRPIDGTVARILDAELHPVPSGSPGHLYLSGTGLAWGYVGKPGLTARRFLPDPFGGEEGARLYDTGDLARFLPDGSIDFLGRADDQVKISGFRVEPAEITAALRLHPAVKDACAIAVAGPAGSGSRLVAYVVSTSGPGSPGAAELSDHLRRFLPVYMLPAAYRWLDVLPLTTNGKVDRAALPDPDLARQADTGAPDASTLEQRIASIWAEVLARGDVGPDEHFFDLGGNSLLLSQVRARITRQLGWRPPLVALFEHPTVHTLARYLAEAADSRSAGIPDDAVQ